MLLSIIIPAFNEEKFIKESLDKIKLALLEMSRKDFSWEIIVCDNNSSDQTAKIASEQGAFVVFEPLNQISRARNTGAEAAKGEWLLFIDADSYCSSAMMSEILDLIETKKYIGCGATVKVKGGSLINKLRMERLNPMFRLFKYCGGVFILCQKEAFQKIDGFSLDLYAFEEFDFVARLKRYGRKVGKKFAILYKNPVITSGRKVDNVFLFFISLFKSTLVALLTLLFYFILPKKLRPNLGRRFLGYWYHSKR